jgi:glycerol-3-phosphate O-acyltransferase/dihydroxyacetone phosphate acyltransferase
MALGAMASDPACKVKIVPVGLSYFHPHRFRSRAVVEFGSAMDVPPELVEMFKEGGAQKREATAKLLDLIHDGLKTVTLLAPDYDTLMVSSGHIDTCISLTCYQVAQAARRLYDAPGQQLSLGQVVELNRRFLEGYTHFKDEHRVKALRENVLKYNRLLRDLGIRDHQVWTLLSAVWLFEAYGIRQVPRAERALWKTLGLLFYRSGLLLAWTLLALPGVIINGPIFITASIMSKKKAKGCIFELPSTFLLLMVCLEALAASNVKVRARDVIASWKILISIGLAPILYGFYAFLAVAIAIRAGASLQCRILTPFLLLAALPFIGFAALKFGEAGMDVFK